MSDMQPAATPQDAAPEQNQPAIPTEKSLDEKILEKFGLGETEEQPPQPEETPSEGEGEIDPEAQPEEPVEEAPDFELKHNGEIKRVPKTEAQRLAQMGYDYEFKMQRVQADAQRVQAMAQASQARAAIQAQALDALAEAKSYERQLHAFANVDWVAEGQQDPIGAFQKRMQYDQLVNAYQGAQAKVQQLQQPYQQAQQHIDANWAALQEQKLLDRIPEWKDGTKRGQESKDIMQTLGKDYGFSEEELTGPLLYDHRVIALMRDAYKYRQSTSAAKARKGQLQGLPKVATPGAKPAPRSQSQSIGDVKRGLRQVQSKEARKALEDELIARKFGLK